MIIFEYKWHLIFAFLTLFVLLIITPFKISFLFIIGLFIGCTLPDIDTKKSTINNLLIITKPCSILFTHRGFTHSFICFVAISYFSSLLDFYFNLNGFSLGIFIGYLSHIVTDMFTPMGIQLLWPLPIFIKVPILSYNQKISKIFLIAIFLFIVLKYLF